MGSHSESLKQLAPALLRVQKALRPVAKCCHNPEFGSSYADLSSILAECLPHLNAEGILLLQPASVARTEGGAAIGVNVETQLVHAESGEFLSEVLSMPCDLHDAQAIGSALTYGRRYGLSSLLGLATEADDDGNGAVRTRAKAEAPTPAPPAVPAPKPATTRVEDSAKERREQQPRPEPERVPTPAFLRRLTERCFSRPGPDGKPAYHEEEACGFRPWLRDHFGVEHPRHLNFTQRVRFLQLLRETPAGSLYDYRSPATATDTPVSSEQAATSE